MEGRAPERPASTLAEALREQKARSRARSPAAFAAAERLIEGLRQERVEERAPGVGRQAPDFVLPNLRGASIRLGDLLGRSAVVLAFYRGNW